MLKFIVNVIIVIIILKDAIQIKAFIIESKKRIIKISFILRKDLIYHINGEDK